MDRACTGGAVKVDTGGTLYPSLHRLEERGFVIAEWGVTQTKHEAKFYRLTALGKKRLVTAQDDWNRFAVALASVLTTKPEPA